MRPAKLIAISLLLLAQLDAAPVAVVVSPNLPVSEVSFAEVRKLYLGDRQFWTPQLRVVLLMRAPVAPERDVILRTIYQMSEAQFRQYWISKVFRADVAAAPKNVYSAEMAYQLVGTIPGAVAFVDAAQIPKGLKVLKIDGKLPGDKAYPLH